MRLERELEANVGPKRQSCTNEGTPLHTRLFFHSFNKNVLCTKPLPGVVPLGARRSGGEGNSGPPEAGITPTERDRSAMGRRRPLPSPG